MYIIESWWRHQGALDREQASGIKYDWTNLAEYLDKTDEWWDSLTDKEKQEVYNEFFEEV